MLKHSLKHFTTSLKYRRTFIANFDISIIFIENKIKFSIDAKVSLVYLSVMLSSLNRLTDFNKLTRRNFFDKNGLRLL